MDKKQKDEITNILLGLSLTETKAINRALRYHMKKFRGKHGAPNLQHYMQKLETVQKCLSGLNDIERNIVEVIIHMYDKGAMKAYPYTLIRGVEIHNSAYRFLNVVATQKDLELLIGALAMYRATPGIAKKYKKECVELRTKIFGGVLND